MYSNLTKQFRGRGECRLYGREEWIDLFAEEGKLLIRCLILLCLHSILRSPPRRSSRIFPAETIPFSHTSLPRLCDSHESRKIDNYAGNDTEVYCGGTGRNADVEKEEKRDGKT